MRRRFFLAEETYDKEKVSRIGAFDWGVWPVFRLADTIVAAGGPNEDESNAVDTAIATDASKVLVRFEESDWHVTEADRAEVDVCSKFKSKTYR